MKAFIRNHPEIAVGIAGGLLLLTLDNYVTAVILREAQKADLARTVSESLGG